MAPPGHIAAGYLVSEALLRTLHFNISQHQFQILVWWGMFFGFAPDLDFFIAFAQARAFKVDLSKSNHRKFISHAPLLWLLAGLLIFFFAQTDFYKAFGLIVWLASWSHFILDSEWGIMWAWPFSKRMYPFSAEYYQRKTSAAIQEEKTENKLSFLKYWSKFAIKYYTSSPSGIIEIIIIIISLIYVTTISHR